MISSATLSAFIRTLVPRDAVLRGAGGAMRSGEESEEWLEGMCASHC